jgi:hypothetical protein
MRKVYLPLLLLILCGSCSRVFGPKEVECCEKTAACCHEQMCCLPRYTKAAGLEPKPFTTAAPVYGTAQDLEPPPGAVIVKPGLLSRFNPFRRSADGQKPQDQSRNGQANQDTATDEKKEDKGFFGRLLPF